MIDKDSEYKAKLEQLEQVDTELQKLSSQKWELERDLRNDRLQRGFALFSSFLNEDLPDVTQQHFVFHLKSYGGLFLCHMSLKDQREIDPLVQQTIDGLYVDVNREDQLTIDNTEEFSWKEFLEECELAPSEQFLDMFALERLHKFLS